MVVIHPVVTARIAVQLQSTVEAGSVMDLIWVNTLIAIALRPSRFSQSLLSDAEGATGRGDDRAPAPVAGHWLREAQTIPPAPVAPGIEGRRTKRHGISAFGGEGRGAENGQNPIA